MIRRLGAPIALFAVLVTLPAAKTLATGTASCHLSVLVGGSAQPQYHHRGATYIEAIRDANYSLRLENPTPYRVAVALSVDGLNTIDARHTDARSASKWILGPYDSIEIAGWQVSDRDARRFVFTGERESYGAALGEIDNLGVIEAVFFRERTPLVQLCRECDRDRAEEGERRAERKSAAKESAAGAERPAASPNEARSQLADDYAATGMGDRTDHRVHRVRIDLEPRPIASVRLRYEFRKQLVELGVLPPFRSPRERRAHARGFEPYCPEPGLPRR